MPYTYPYPRPSLTVDCVVFGYSATETLKVLLIKRKLPPFQDQWALPGGFVLMNESVEAAAARELSEETGVKDIFLEQLYTFGAVDRDPRDRVISVAYYALINRQVVRAASDASDAQWFDLSEVIGEMALNKIEELAIEELAFDHRRILQCATERLKNKIRYEPIGFKLLPEHFTLSQLQQLYEQILERTLDKRNFRKKLLKMDLLLDTGQKETGVAHRAAKLYKFDAEKYEQLKQKGFNFDL